MLCIGVVYCDSIEFQERIDLSVYEILRDGSWKEESGERGQRKDDGTIGRKNERMKKR